MVPAPWFQLVLSNFHSLSQLAAYVNYLQLDWVIETCTKMASYYESLEIVLKEKKWPYSLKKKQLDALKSIWDGNDTLAIFPTSFGKSDLLVLPPLLEDKVATVSCSSNISRLVKMNHVILSTSSIG